ncbi:MAG: GNAT family N-acetyltransferase [Pirellulales bacterium]|nr:GNAT family N-acetyltransferase [Pirellulales bacterium]
MLTFRSFRNTDPPLLTALWRSQAGQSGLLQPVSSDLFEQLIFSKLYFDYPGLIFAFDGATAVGCVHAGFGPNQAQDRVICDAGVTNLLLVRPGDEEEEVASELLLQSEAYLRGRGAKVLYGGGLRPLSPFYLGLYGGSEPSGILDTDRPAQRVFERHDYRVVETARTLEFDLTGFEPVIDRRQMQIRRQMVVEVAIDAPTRTWWEACILGEFDLTRFTLLPRGGAGAAASALFRRMEPRGITHVGRKIGLLEFFVDPLYRRRGVATFLLSEAFRQFHRQGIALVEAQVLGSNVPGLNLHQKFGFRKTGESKVYRKEV